MKTALISGGTRGIGLAIAKTLATNGYRVVTFSRTATETDTFAGKIAEAGGEGLAYVGDVRDDAFLAHVVTETRTQYGAIDVLINNAGGGKRDRIAEALVPDWDFILDTNLRAAMVLTKLCLADLTRAPGGAVITIASLAGKIGIAQESAYCAAKFGLIGFSQALFEETRALGLKVCVLCPGLVDTRLIPNRKALMRDEMIRPDDIANAIKFVLECSPSACPTEIQIRPQRSPIRG